MGLPAAGWRAGRTKPNRPSELLFLNVWRSKQAVTSIFMAANSYVHYAAAAAVG
jgi:hypothetical protein